MPHFARLPFVTLAIIALAGAAPGTAAEQPVRRFSLQASAGLNTVLPTYEFQVGYRLPLLENRLEPFISYSPWSASLSAATFSIGQLGCRVYGNSLGPVQPFVVASAGYSDNSYAGIQPAFMGGGGADWMLTPSLGITGSVTLGVPTLVRPMVALRLAF